MVRGMLAACLAVVVGAMVGCHLAGGLGDLDFRDAVTTSTNTVSGGAGGTGGASSGGAGGEGGAAAGGPGGGGGAGATGGGAGACDTSGPVDVRVMQSSDDAEEAVATGGMYLDSSDLELGQDPSGPTDQIVGIRLVDVAVPRGAVISSAELRFTTDEVSTSTAPLVVRGQAADDAATFTSSGNDISGRSLTSASVAWSPAEWLTEGEVHVTPELAPIVQEIVDRSGWSACNALVFVVSGSGRRTAVSYDGDASAAPLLHVEFTPPQPIARRSAAPPP